MDATFTGNSEEERAIPTILSIKLYSFTYFRFFLPQECMHSLDRGKVKNHPSRENGQVTIPPSCSSQDFKHVLVSSCQIRDSKRDQLCGNPVSYLPHHLLAPSTELLSAFISPNRTYFHVSPSNSESQNMKTILF